MIFNDIHPNTFFSHSQQPPPQNIHYQSANYNHSNERNLYLPRYENTIQNIRYPIYNQYYPSTKHLSSMQLEHHNRIKYSMALRYKANLLKQIFSMVANFLDLASLYQLLSAAKLLRQAVINSSIWKNKAIYLHKNLRGHIDSINSLVFVSSFVLSASSDGQIKIWNLNHDFSSVHLKNISSLPRLNFPLNLDDQHKMLSIPQRPLPNSLKLNNFQSNPRIEHNQTYSIVQMNTYSEQNENFSECYKANPITCLCLLKKKSTPIILIGFQNGILASRTLLNSIELKSENQLMKVHNGMISAIVTNFNHTVFFSSSSDFDINVYNSVNYEIITKLKSHTSEITCLTVDIYRLFSADFSGNILVWNILSNKFEYALSCNTHNEFSDGLSACITTMLAYKHRLYVGSWDCHIHIFDTHKLFLLNSVFIQPIGICWSLAIRELPNHPPVLIVGVRDGEIEFRSIENDNSLPIISSNINNCWCPAAKNHKEPIRSILTLVDGKIITGASDGSVKVWNYCFSALTRTSNSQEFKNNIIPSTVSSQPHPMPAYNPYSHKYRSKINHNYNHLYNDPNLRISSPSEYHNYFGYSRKNPLNHKLNLPLQKKHRTHFHSPNYPMNYQTRSSESNYFQSSPFPEYNPQAVQMNNCVTPSMPIHPTEHNEISAYVQDQRSPFFQKTVNSPVYSQEPPLYIHNNQYNCDPSKIPELNYLSDYPRDNMPNLEN